MTLQAWVESPLQILNAVEYAHAQQASIVIHARGGSESLTRAARLLEPHLPAGVVVRPDSRSAMLSPFAAASRRIVGDAYSGQVRAVIAMAGARRSVLVDDGSIMLALGEQLARDQALQRPGIDEGWPMRVLGRIATHRLRTGLEKGRVEVFTAYADRAPFRELAKLGGRISRNTYDWVRGVRLDEAAALRPTVIVGAALVPDGHLLPTPYLAWLRDRAAQGDLTYVPHRREHGPWLDEIAAIPGVDVLDAGLPIEVLLGAASASVGSVVTMPSSVVATLRAVLPPEVDLEVRGIPPQWWSESASPTMKAMIEAIQEDDPS